MHRVHLQEQREGAALLTVVLLMAAAMLVIVASVAALGADAYRSRRAFEDTDGARMVAEACAEDALLQIRRDATFGSGGAPMSWEDGDAACTTTILVEDDGQQRLTVTGTRHAAQHDLAIVFTRDVRGVVTLHSWSEDP